MANMFIYSMIEKCIIPEAEVNNILFIYKAISSSSLAYNLDQAIEKLKNKSSNIKLDVLTVIEERQIYWQSKEDKESFA